MKLETVKNLFLNQKKRGLQDVEQQERIKRANYLA